MPRKNRQPSQSGYYHFINRGVNKKKIFHRPEDFTFYKLLLGEYKLEFDIKIIHYCLMSNHTHLVVYSPDVTLLGRLAHFLQRRYAYYYCKTYKWQEQVFRNRYLSLPIEKDSYLMECGRYIERNPLEANLVSDLKDYEHSSYHYYALGREDRLVTESPFYEDLGRTREERALVYRYNVLNDRDSALEKNKTLKRILASETIFQPVPF